jgi:hypothetical protein
VIGFVGEDRVVAAKPVRVEFPLAHRHPRAADQHCDGSERLTGLAITQITPRYTATGKLLYDPSGYKLQELQSILQVDPMTDAVMASQAEVLRCSFRVW